MAFYNWDESRNQWGGVLGVLGVELLIAEQTYHVIAFSVAQINLLFQCATHAQYHATK